VGLVNCRFVKPLDRDLLASLARRYSVLLTVEENVLLGGFGSAVAEALREQGGRQPGLRHAGVPDRFVAHGGRDQLLAEIGLAPAQLEDRVRILWKETQ